MADGYRLYDAAQGRLIATGKQNCCPENQKDGIEGNKANHNNVDIGRVYEIYREAGNLRPIRHGGPQKAAFEEKPFMG